MPQYVAFLRGINVGGHRLSMKRLTELLTSAGLSDVDTLLASGNVIFRTGRVKSHRLAESLESILQSALGYPVPVILRTPAEVTELVEHTPFTTSGRGRASGDVYVMLLPAFPPADAQEQLNSVATADDDFQIRGRELYWLRRRPVSMSKIPDAVFRQALGHSGTTRNLNTLVKLRARLDKVGRSG